MDAKDLIQKAWVIEGMLLIAYLAVACWFMPVERLEVFNRMLPTLILLVTGQGAAAAIGPEVKRKIEAGKK